MAQDTAVDLRAASKARIYFGHHSVGDDLLNGLRRILDETPGVSLEIVDLEPAAKLPEAYLAHSRIGTNRDPMSKLNAFADTLQMPVLAQAEHALMKFCYVDFDPMTDVASLFEQYQDKMEKVTREHPKVNLLHATVPLKARRVDIKGRIKLLLGKTLWEDESNIKRHLFNESLRHAYEDDRIVDIARSEATRPDGSMETFSQSGRSYPCMHAGLTRDGGHLNGVGEQQVARELIRVLARNVGS